MTLRLHTFGRVHLTRNGEVLSGAAGQRRLLAILSILAAAGERGVTRDKLLSLLWADGDAEKSRHALTQSLYHIRKVLGVDRLFLGTADVRLETLPDVSRVHFRVRYHPEDGRFSIEDLSLLGTTVNGEPLGRGAPQPLPSPAEIRLADAVTLRFDCEALS